MLNFSTSIFPEDSAALLIGYITSVISQNIVVVLSVCGFIVAIKLIVSGKLLSLRSALNISRPHGRLQSKIEEAHNRGDFATEKSLTSKVSDHGYDPTYRASASEKAAMIAKARKSIN